MGRTVRSLLVALALIGISVASAEAVDLCFEYAAGVDTIVGKGFKVPGKNKCAPFNGFQLGSHAGMVTGTGCRNAQGDWLLIHYTYHDHDQTFPQGSYFETGVCRVPLPIEPGGNSGDCAGTYQATSNAGSVSENRFDANARFYRCTFAVPD